MTPTALPPSLSSSALAQGVLYFNDPTAFLDRAQARFGDVFSLRFPGSPPQVCLSNPADLAAMYTGDASVFHAGEAAGAVFAPLTGRRCTLTLDGPAHARRRALVQAPFSESRAARHAAAMYDVARRAIHDFPRDRTFALHPRMQEIALRVVFRAVLGLDDRDPARAPLFDLIGRLASLGMGSPMLLVPALRWDLGRYSPWGRIERLVRDTDALLFAEIARRRADPKAELADDVLSLLLAARDDGQRLTDRELRDEIVALLLAGHETTAAALTWAVERVLAVPRVRKRLLSEVESLGRSGDLDISRIERLAWLDATIKESLRYHALSPICGGRVLKAPFTLREHTLPPGTVLLNCPYLLHRRADIYPDPREFRPERFLDKPPSPFAWTPFGGGARRCVGRRFAQLEIKVVIATLVSETDLRLAVPRVTAVPEGIHLLPARGLPVHWA